MAVTVLTAGVRYEPAPLGLGGWATTPTDRGRTLGEATGPAGCALPQGEERTPIFPSLPRRGVQTCMHGPRQQTGKASVLLCVCAYEQYASCHVQTKLAALWSTVAAPCARIGVLA